MLKLIVIMFLIVSMFQFISAETSLNCGGDGQLQINCPLSQENSLNFQDINSKASHFSYGLITIFGLIFVIGGIGYLFYKKRRSKNG